MKTSRAKVAFTAAEEAEWPVCPYCKQELREIKYKHRGWLYSLTVFWCPKCRSLLGTSSSFNG